MDPVAPFVSAMDRLAEPMYVMTEGIHISWATERRPRRKTVFLEALVDTVNVTLACRRAGIARRTAYDWRDYWLRYLVDFGIIILQAECGVCAEVG